MTIRKKKTKRKRSPSSSDLVLRFHLFIAVAPKKHQTFHILTFFGPLSMFQL